MNSGVDYQRKPDSVGVPVPVVDVRVVDTDGNDVPLGEVGELWIQGPNVVKGYWGMPDATEQTFGDGWLKSGDLARVDDEGFVYIVDRAKDMVIRGGENVYCVEVEGGAVRASRRGRRRGDRRAAPGARRGGRRGRRAAAPGSTVTADDLRAHVARAARRVQGARARVLPRRAAARATPPARCSSASSATSWSADGRCARSRCSARSRSSPAAAAGSAARWCSRSPRPARRW